MREQGNKGLASATFSSGEKRETFILSPDSWRVVVVARAEADVMRHVESAIEVRERLFKLERSGFSDDLSAKVCADALRGLRERTHRKTNTGDNRKFNWEKGWATSK